MRIRIFFLMLISWLACMTVGGQNLKLPISNYTNKTYGRQYGATNYCILSDHRNMIYAGNANGIMEYDGSHWRFIPVHTGAYVTSMDISSSGIIFVGSQQEFGFLAVDRVGSLLYRSLSDSLPGADRRFSTIWATHAADDFVAFQAYECLFLYRAGELRAIYPETSFHTSFLVAGRLFVRERGSGLKVLEGDKLIPLEGGTVFGDLGVFGMFPLNDGESILIATTEKGFYRYHPFRGIKRMPTDNDAFLIQAGIIGGIVLSDDNIALNTLHEGVLVCDTEGSIKAVINKHAGLQVDDVKGVWQDNTRNIWCALDNGISKIDYASPVSFYYENAGLEGSVYTMIRFDGRMFVGTTAGLFAEDPDIALNRSLEFNAWPGIRDQVWSFQPVGGSLLVGTSNGLYLIRDGSTRRISRINAFAMQWLEKEKLLLVGGTGGLKGFSPQNNWTQLRDFPDITEDIKSIAVNKSSLYEETEIWLGTSLQGTVKILIHPDLSHETFKYYGAADGLPVDWILPMTHHDTLLFGTSRGVLRFIDEKTMRELLPDSLKNSPEYYRGYFENAEIYGHPVVDPLRFLAGADGRTWMVLENEIAFIDRSAPEEIVKRPFRGIDLGKINSIYQENDQTVWFAAVEGLARYDLAAPGKPAVNLYPLIRTVRISGDSLIFNGNFEIPGDFTAEDPGAQFMQPQDRIPVLHYSYNDLSFYFTAPFYDREEDNRFSWMLSGYEDDWNNWSGQRLATYTNLHEGSYEFRLRMQNIYGDISEETGYSFAVRPPWTRTPLAYLGYVILLLAFIYLMVRLGQRQLRRKNERLEATVRERTEEIRQQNIRLAAQKKEITDSIYYAERIQRAILPRTERISETIGDYFILFKPKDIVSGDFYWLAENGKKIIVTAVDCTGHGVPGAFMSMLGVSFLNKIILENNTLEADRILNELRENVVSSLKQTGREGEARDGMDMALVVIDLQNMTMEFAGANNPLYMIREDQLNETKPDRMPISFHMRSEQFSSHRIPLTKGDTIYLFSDGYADQFGGPKGKKLKYRAFKEILLENRDKPMNEIHRILDETYEAWKSPQGPGKEGYEQVDDVLVIGLRV